MKTQIKAATLDKAIEVAKQLSKTEGTAYVIKDHRANVYFVESVPGMVRNFESIDAVYMNGREVNKNFA